MTVRHHVCGDNTGTEKMLDKMMPKQEEKISSEKEVLLGLVAKASNVDDIITFYNMMQELERSNERKAFLRDMSRMQGKLTPVQKNAKAGNDRFEIRYAPYEEITAMITPLLAEHGFCIDHEINMEHDGIEVVCVVSHVEGHEKRTSVKIGLAFKGISGAHAVGSAITYGRRYSLTAALNIATVGEDDDGNAVEVTRETDRRITAAEYLKLRADGEGVVTNWDAFAHNLGLFNELELHEITKSQLARAHALIASKRRRLEAEKRNAETADTGMVSSPSGEADGEPDQRNHAGAARRDENARELPKLEIDGTSDGRTGTDAGHRGDAVGS